MDIFYMIKYVLNHYPTQEFVLAMLIANRGGYTNSLYVRNRLGRVIRTHGSSVPLSSRPPFSTTTAKLSQNV